jgi:hypothetical protein
LFSVTDRRDELARRAEELKRHEHQRNDGGDEHGYSLECIGPGHASHAGPPGAEARQKRHNENTGHEGDTAAGESLNEKSRSHQLHRGIRNEHDEGYRCRDYRDALALVAMGEQLRRGDVLEAVSDEPESRPEDDQKNHREDEIGHLETESADSRAIGQADEADQHECAVGRRRVGHPRDKALHAASADKKLRRAGTHTATRGCRDPGRHGGPHNHRDPDVERSHFSPQCRMW